MTSRKSAPPNPNALQIPQQSTETSAEATASTVLRPTVQASVTLREYNKPFGETSLNRLVEDLAKQCQLASQGDLKRSEAMLTAQAHTLDAIFNSLARRAALNLGEYINAAEIYLRLALKAQSQCRGTLETLAAIKNPASVAFVRQANIAHGPQQVNNNAQQAPNAETSRARESENSPNELLEQQQNDRLDTRSTQAAIRADSALATMGEVHRAADPGR